MTHLDVEDVVLRSAGEVGADPQAEVGGEEVPHAEPTGAEEVLALVLRQVAVGGAADRCRFRASQPDLEAEHEARQGLLDAEQLVRSAVVAAVNHS